MPPEDDTTHFQMLLEQTHADLRARTEQAYAASPFSSLSRDYFSRF